METKPVESVLLVGAGSVSGFPASPGTRTAHAADLVEASALLSEQAFQLAVLDSDLPPVDGQPPVSILVREHPTLPVLVLASSPTGVSLAQPVRLGAEAVLGPFDLANETELANTLAWAVENARARAEMAFELEDARADLVLQRTAYLKLKDSQKAAAMAMQAMSECNRLLFVLDDERVYIRDFCRILVKRMGLRMAWAGFLEHDPQEGERIVPAGHAGCERNYLTRFRLKAWERRYPKSLARKVIATGEPVAVPDLEASSVDFFRVEEALRRGYRSVAILPLKASLETQGILCLYSAEPATFGPSEIAYFTHVAGEMAHGVQLLRREAGQKS
jgi:CheY-like chemotaxis protein